MGVLRILLLPILAAVLAGCAATIPLHPAPEDVTATIDEPDRPPIAEEPAEAKTETPKPPAPKPATASTTSSKRNTSSKSTPANKNAPSDKNTMNATTPKVGSPEWKKERAEDERKEKHLKEVIEGICRGC
jgi:hypothetical protein